MIIQFREAWALQPGGVQLKGDNAGRGNICTVQFLHFYCSFYIILGFLHAFCFFLILTKFAFLPFFVAFFCVCFPAFLFDFCWKVFLAIPHLILALEMIPQLIFGPDVS